jgi:hypothetical protein
VEPLVTHAQEVALAAARLWRDRGNKILIGALVAEVLLEIWQDNHHGWSLWTPHEDTSSFKWHLKRKLIRLRGRIPSKSRLMIMAALTVVAGVALETWYGWKADDASDNIRARLEYDALGVSQRGITNRFATFLKGKPKGEVRVLYKHEDVEAYWFAFWIKGALDEAGWITSGPESIPLDGGDPRFADKDVPSEIRYGAQSGLSIWGRSLSWDEGNTAGNALKNAIGLGADRGGVMMLLNDASLPENHFIVVVGRNSPTFQE